MAEPINLDTTYEDLMEQKLAKFSEMDRRETSPLYIATAANTAEIVQMLATIKNNIDLVFADTAPREYLIRRAAERGLSPYPATKARLKGEFNIDVPIGSRFSGDDLNYIVVEKIDDGKFILECESAGEAGNLYLGTLIPIDYIAGLETAKLTEVLIPGEDEEDTEAFRTRYFNSFKSIAFGGNRADYKERVGALSGVGGVRVYRAKYGPGTVGLTIINSQLEKPSQALVNAVQEAVDPLTMQGEGVGIAPIDHIVTVSAVEETPIDITLNIAYQNGWTWADIQDDVYRVIDEYFKELAKEWAQAQTYEEDHAGLVVRISQIETRLLGVDGVIDIQNTQLNGGTSNIELDKEAIPVRGVVNG